MMSRQVGKTGMVVTCTWIAHPHTPPSDLVVGDQVCWPDTHAVLGTICSLNVVGSHVLPPLRGSTVPRAAASTDGKKNVASHPLLMSHVSQHLSPYIHARLPAFLPASFSLRNTHARSGEGR
jgi:hypothetical protein